MTTRRNFIVFGSSALVLAACQGQSTATVVQGFVQDLGLIGSGLAGALPGLVASGVVKGGALGTIQSAVANISSIAASVSTSTSVGAGQSTLQQIESLLNTIVGAAAGLPLPPPFGPALVAASVLLPVLEGLIGMVSQLKTPQAAAMTPDQARAVLADAAQGR